jgi:hypothetical protein
MAITTAVIASGRTVKLAKPTGYTGESRDFV